MQIKFVDSFYFWELDRSRFLENLKYYNYRKGKILASGDTVRNLLLIGILPNLRDGAYLFAENFDVATIYSQYSYLGSDDVTYLQFKQGETERYFGVGQEPRHIYVGPYDKKRILRAAKRHEEEYEYDPKAFIKTVEQFVPQSTTLDKVGIFISM